MLTQVHFAGIKSLLDVTVDLDRFTVLVGPNGCGKSTLLNQIELLCRMSAPGLQPSTFVLGWAGEQLNGVNPLSIRTSRQTPAMCWQGLDDVGRALHVSIPAGTGPSWWDGALVRIPGGDLSLVLSAGADGPKRMEFDDYLRKQISWRVQRLRLIPDAVARPSRVRTTGLDPSGHGLPTLLKDLAADDPPIYRALQDDLKRVVPQFERLSLGKSVEGNDSDMNTLFLEMRGGGRLPASQVSDGTLLALAVLTAAHNPAMPPLILIDDIDHGLHLAAQYAIVKAIRVAMESRPDLQVVCTTHAPILLDSFDPSEVRVMTLDREGYSVIKKLTEHPQFDRYKETLQTGELWASTGEDWVVDASATG